MKTKPYNEEFEEKINELNNTHDFTKDKDGVVHEFGYKTLRGNEIFTIVDWDNIKQFHAKRKEMLIQSVENKREESLQIGNPELHWKEILKLIEDIM